MVEFSDTGALYVYDRGNTTISFIDKGKNTIGSVADLKQTSLPLLVEESYYSYYYSEEGRHNHRGEWERRLRVWMQRYIFNSTEQDISNSRDDEIFVSKPLPSQSPSPQFREEDVSSPKNMGRQTVNIQTSLFSEENDDFETNLKFSLASKWIFGKFRVVGGTKGFYINVRNKFYFIKELEEKELPEGNIWVKHPKNGWFNVVHYHITNGSNIGYIKIDLNTLLYKRKEGDNTYKTIKL